MPKPTTAEHVQKLIEKIVLKNDDKITLVLKDLAPADADALKAALKVVQGLGDKVDPEMVQGLMTLIGTGAAPDADKAKEDAAAAASVPALKERADKAEAELAKVTKEKKTAEDNAEFPIKKDGTIDEEKIPEAIRKSVVALWNKSKADGEKLAVIQKSLDDERDARVLKAFETEAAADFKALAVKPEELAKVLKEVSTKASTEVFTSLKTILKAANEAVAKADPTGEIGSSRNAGGAPVDSNDAFAKIEKAAVAHFAGEKKITKESAFDQYITKTDEGRKAYAEYRRMQETK